MGQIYYIMSIARNHVNHSNIVTVHFVIDYILRPDLTQLYQAMSAYDNKLFILCVMPVLTFGYSRLGNINTELPCRHCTQNFRKASPIIGIHLKPI